MWFRCIIALSILVTTGIATDAKTLRMRVGRDAFVFDFNYQGRTIQVYVREPGEPLTEQSVQLAKDQEKLDEIMDSDPRFRDKFVIGRSAGIFNAFAVIYLRKRYIVYDPSILSGWATPDWFVLFGHEMGHHVCGHQEGMFSDKPWIRELEADQFSGYVIRLLEYKYSSFENAINSASRLYSPFGTTTHPPRDQRIAAIMEGYNNGSPCVERKLMNPDAPPNCFFFNGQQFCQ